MNLSTEVIKQLQTQYALSSRVITYLYLTYKHWLCKTDQEREEYEDALNIMWDLLDEKEQARVRIFSSNLNIIRRISVILKEESND